MKTIKKIGLAVALIPLLGAMSAHANIFEVNNASTQGGEFFEDVFFGGAFGQSEADDYCGTSSSCTEDDTSWKIYGGYKINDMIDAEVAYNSIGDLNREGEAGRETAEIDALSISAVGKYEINDSVEALGKIGATRWTSNNSDGDEDGFSINYGFGAKVRLNETMKLRAEWESISDVETAGGRKTDVTTMSLGIELETL
ncbi:outer membrane beta-barrel protein [Leucothrix arctica]|nr:outer membrane beta-barrel protein [Leucothrix arctica]